jgi:hypothetical protein
VNVTILSEAKAIPKCNTVYSVKTHFWHIETICRLRNCWSGAEDHLSRWLTIFADALCDIEAFIHAYATEVELGAMDEERIGVHRRSRKAMLHHLVPPN